MVQAISVLVVGILAMLAGIIILIKPQIITWVVGILLILAGIGALVASLSYLF